MTAIDAMKPVFVEFIPENLENGVIYISRKYGTASHKCCCGCGTKVVTPITPTDWNLSFDGKSVSLSPSIGNSELPCKSHYWIQKNRVIWESPMSPQLTAFSRARERRRKSEYFNRRQKGEIAEPLTQKSWGSMLQSLWGVIKSWFN